MQTSPVCPFEHLHWTADQLTAAVPLRLHQIDLFDAASHADASNEPRQRLRIAHGYRSDPAPSAPFRIR